MWCFLEVGVYCFGIRTSCGFDFSQNDDGGFISNEFCVYFSVLVWSIHRIVSMPYDVVAVRRRYHCRNFFSCSTRVACVMTAPHQVSIIRSELNKKLNHSLTKKTCMYVCIVYAYTCLVYSSVRQPGSCVCVRATCCVCCVCCCCGLHRSSLRIAIITHNTLSVYFRSKPTIFEQINRSVLRRVLRCVSLFCVVLRLAPCICARVMQL